MRLATPHCWYDCFWKKNDEYNNYDHLGEVGNFDGIDGIGEIEHCYCWWIEKREWYCWEVEEWEKVELLEIDFHCYYWWWL